MESLINKKYIIQKNTSFKVIQKLKIKPKKILNRIKIARRLKKKWRFWRGFKQFFINKKKITFFKKLQWNFNEKRLIWHQFAKSYLPKIKSVIKNNNKKKYYNFLGFFELRLPVILLRSRFFTKLVNCYDSIKKNLICVNGIILNKKNYMLSELDLYQKRRHIKQYLPKEKKNKGRLYRLRWRKFRWKKAKFIFWKIRRNSHFNLFLNKKVNNFVNYLEINYKIPAGIVLKKPSFKEILINRQKEIISNKILKKIFFLY